MPIKVDDITILQDKLPRGDALNSLDVNHSNVCMMRFYSMSAEEHQLYILAPYKVVLT